MIDRWIEEDVRPEDFMDDEELEALELLKESHEEDDLFFDPREKD